MVAIAETIKHKLARKELNLESEEMKEIQIVMFNMGMTDGFTSHVTKDMSGKKFYKDLAIELEKFLDKIIN